MNLTRILFMLGLTLALALAGCQPAERPAAEEAARDVGEVELTSPAFGEGGTIPVQYTCEGEDISPPLNWRGVPEEAQSLALILEDPDAPLGTWVHWVVYDIPPEQMDLAEGAAAADSPAEAGAGGRNSFRNTGYGGPCPPPGPAHRYFFKLYALDTVLSLEPGASKDEVEEAMEGHILARGELVGTYSR